VSGLPAYLRETAEGCTLAVRVQPGAKRTAILGVYGEGEQAQLKIALQAPPVDGRANEALIEFLAQLAGVPKSSVTILTGHSSRTKVYAIKAKAGKAVCEKLADFRVEPM
jgi:uncharacterized protein (TIGR00251 family)